MAWPSRTSTKGTAALISGAGGTITWNHTCASGETLLAIATGTGFTGGASAVTVTTTAGETTLAAAITTTGQTSMSVASAAQFPQTGQFYVLVDSEVMQVTAGAGTTSWTMTRGQLGTTAATHTNGTATYWFLPVVSGSTGTDSVWCGSSIAVGANPHTGVALPLLVRVNASGSTQVATHATSFDGADTTLGNGGSGVNGTGTSTNPQKTGITTVSGDQVLSMCCNDNETGTLTPDGTSLQSDANVDNDIDVSTQVQTASGTSTTASWTDAVSGGGWSISAIVVRQAAGNSYTLTAAQGSYSLTGQAANLLVNKLLVADQGSYALTGQAANLSYSAAGRTLIADTGFYTLVGSDALVDLGMNAEFGTYNLTGQDAILTYAPLNSYTLVAASGTYNLNGQDANLLMGRVLPCVSGQYNLTGFASGLIWSGAAASGAYHGKIHMGLSDFRL